LQVDPDQIVQEGHLEVRSSKTLASVDTPEETKPPSVKQKPRPLRP